MIKRSFGILPTGEEAFLYTIRCGNIKAAVSDFGATLVSLWVPDKDGNLADVVLGFEDAASYAASDTFFGATVGRNANRIGGAAFSLGGKTYALEPPGTLSITYDGVCDADTVFNMTNHSYFNLAGHKHPDRAMSQILSMSAGVYSVADGESITTGELRAVDGTPMDFRNPKPIGRDINAHYDALLQQGGYDHNFEVFSNPCAVLTDPVSGRPWVLLPIAPVSSCIPETS